MKEGKIFIITGPTCSGKTVISENILAVRKNTTRAISVTVRPPRIGEINAKHYFFVSLEDFEKMIKQNKFIEYCIVHNYYYGTTIDSFNLTKGGLDVIKVIDPQGALKLKNILPNALFFFFSPKSFDIVKNRLDLEREDKNNDLRLKNYDIAMQYKDNFDYYIDTSGDSSETSIDGCTNKVLSIMDERSNIG